jgi:hypothetical protein
MLLLMTLAAMLATTMALSGVAQAKPTIGPSTDAKCARLAVQTLGSGFKPANYNFIGGTEGDDFFNYAGYGNGVPDVYCGFGGADSEAELEEGDIFIGGAGDDIVYTNYGTVYGGEGNDTVWRNYGGTFYGGEGNDWVQNNEVGTVYGGADDDIVEYNRGTFHGGTGDDSVVTNYPNSTFYGEEGNDSVFNNGGTFEQ